jgi:hypothetical protein
MASITVDQFLARLISDAEFRSSFFVDPLDTCADELCDLTWSEIAALLCIAEPMLAEFARGVPNFGPNFGWKEDTTNRVALKSH